MDPQLVLSDAQSLSTFLTIEGFLLATVSLAVTLGAPGKTRILNLPVAPFHIAMGAAILACIAASGGVAAWWGLYGEGELLPLRGLWIAVALLAIIVAQPVIALLLAQGTRFKS